MALANPGLAEIGKLRAQTAPVSIRSLKDVTACRTVRPDSQPGRKSLWEGRTPLHCRVVVEQRQKNGNALDNRCP